MSNKDNLPVTKLERSPENTMKDLLQCLGAQVIGYIGGRGLKTQPTLQYDPLIGTIRLDIHGQIFEGEDAADVAAKIVQTLPMYVPILGRHRRH